MPVATLAELKSYLELTATTHDTRLTDALTRAQAIAESYCLRKFDEATFTEFFDGEGRRAINVRNFPIVSVTSVHDDLERAYGATTLLDATSYSIDKDRGIIQQDDGLFFLDGNLNVKVIYVGGFGGTFAVPADIKQAVILIASALFEERKNIGVSSRSLGDGGSTNYRHGIPEEALIMLMPYKGRLVG